MTIDKEKLPPNPSAWASPDSAKTELINHNEPIDYNKLVGDARVLFLGEFHTNSPIREHIASFAQRLKDAGITHLAIEFPKTEENLRRLKNLPVRLAQGSVDLSWLNRECPEVSQDRRNYDLVVRELATIGIEVVPVDIVQDGSRTSGQREEDIASNIMKIIESDQDVKVAVLIGAFHTVKKYSSPESGLSVNGRLIKQGVPTVAVQFVGGYDKTPSYVTNAAQQVGLGDKDWMIDMAAYADSLGVPFGAGETDAMIHLSQKESSSTGSDLGDILKLLHARFGESL